jgi:hypothetical protein
MLPTYHQEIGVSWAVGLRTPTTRLAVPACGGGPNDPGTNAAVTHRSGVLDLFGHSGGFSPFTSTLVPVRLRQLSYVPSRTNVGLGYGSRTTPRASVPALDPLTFAGDAGALESPTRRETQPEDGGQYGCVKAPPATGQPAIVVTLRFMSSTPKLKIRLLRGNEKPTTNDWYTSGMSGIPFAKKSFLKDPHKTSLGQEWKGFWVRCSSIWTNETVARHKAAGYGLFLRTHPHIAPLPSVVPSLDNTPAPSEAPAVVAS